MLNVKAHAEYQMLKSLPGLHAHCDVDATGDDLSLKGNYFVYLMWDFMSMTEEELFAIEVMPTRYAA
jgi:hypothetical protein